MLQSLLPGFRHLRAPLVAGYVWLLGLWLLLREPVLRQEQPTRIHQGIIDVANWAGRPATLAGITLVAYLIGTLSIAATRTISKVAGRLNDTWLKWFIPSYWTDKRLDAALRENVDRRMSEHYLDNQQFRNLLTSHLSQCRERAQRSYEQLHRWVRPLAEAPNLEQTALQDEYTRWRLIHWLVKKDQYVTAAREDLGHLAYRLLGKEEHVHAEYDRLIAEGTFRFGLTLPLAFLCFTLANISNSWLWLTGLAIPLTFAYLAGGSFAEAEYGLAAAVSSGRVDLPSLEQIPAREVVLEPFEELVEDNRNEDWPYLRAKHWIVRVLGPG